MTPPDATQVDSAERISKVMNRLRVLIGRRMISRVAIANVVPGAELSFIDVLTHVPLRPSDTDTGSDTGPNPGAQTQGITVGAVATAIRIDPSRASRLVSQMVDRGLLARVASPEDARSSLLVRTDLGERLHQEMRKIKMQLIHGSLDGWTDAEIETFAILFDRFIGNWEQQIDDDTLSSICAPSKKP